MQLTHMALFNKNDQVVKNFSTVLCLYLLNKLFYVADAKTVLLTAMITVTAVIGRRNHGHR